MAQTDRIQSWAVGVTAAPRPKTDTLPRTLASLAAAGFDRGVVYAEPNAPISGDTAWTVVQRPERFGAWQNWLTGLADLLVRHPEADAIMLCQDDVVFCSGLRVYLEGTLWPHADLRRIGLCSPYCAAPFQKSRRGWHRVDAGEHLLGALCWVLPRVTAETIARDWMPQAKKHRQGIDCRIGDWCRRACREVYIHSPSLAQHVGNGNSTLGDKTSNWMRRSHDFIGENASPDGRPPTPDGEPMPADLAVPTQHVIISRYNLGLYADKSKTCEQRKDWLRHRRYLFSEFAVPSMRNQITRDWFWFVAVDDRTPPGYVRWIDDEMEGLPASVFQMGCTGRFEAPKWKAALATAIHADTELLITTRLDTDDAVVPEFCERIRAMANPAGVLPQLLDFPNGYQFDLARGKFHARQHQKGGTRFASILERRVNDEEWQTTLMCDHNKLSASVPSAVYDEHPAWSATIHRSNTVSRLGGAVVDAPEFAWLLNHLNQP